MRKLLLVDELRINLPTCYVSHALLKGDKEAMRGSGSSDAGVRRTGPLPPVLWMAPFFDNSGFGKEAAALVLSLIRSEGVII